MLVNVCCQKVPKRKWRHNKGKVKPFVCFSESWKMDSGTAHDGLSKSSNRESSILREFSPDLGFCSPSPTNSLSDFQDESERIEGSRFILSCLWSYESYAGQIVVIYVLDQVWSALARCLVLRQPGRWATWRNISKVIAQSTFFSHFSHMHGVRWAWAPRDWGNIILFIMFIIIISMTIIIHHHLHHHHHHHTYHQGVRRAWPPGGWTTQSRSRSRGAAWSSWTGFCWTAPQDALQGGSSDNLWSWSTERSSWSGWSTFNKPEAQWENQWESETIEERPSDDKQEQVVVVCCLKYEARAGGSSKSFVVTWAWAGQRAPGQRPAAGGNGVLSTSGWRRSWLPRLCILLSISYFSYVWLVTS